MKNPLTPAGIEPATFRFVAQQLNHCATAVPHTAIIRSTQNCNYSLRYCAATSLQRGQVGHVGGR